VFQDYLEMVWTAQQRRDALINRIPGIECSATTAFEAMRSTEVI